jgi:trk system potassium uptake protein TrkA
MDLEVLAVERDADLVERWSKRLPVVEADATDPRALEQIGAKDFAAAVVGVGTSLEASVLITGNLVDIGIPEIWAKAVSIEHKRILERIGAHHVVLPESDAGARVAHSVGGRMLDYIEIEDGFTIVKMRPPKETHNFTLGKLGLRNKYGIQVIGVKSPGRDFEYAGKETVIHPDDLLVVSGDGELLERFAQRP